MGPVLETIKREIIRIDFWGADAGNRFFDFKCNLFTLCVSNCIFTGGEI
jgi:hypothetical protein